jgi:hypothetical protein
MGDLEVKFTHNFILVNGLLTHNSGKTEAGVFEDLAWSLENPGSVGYIFEPSYPMVKRILIPKLEHFLGAPLESSPLISDFNRGDLRVNMVNGSILWLGSLDHPESAEGANVDFIHVDEARLIHDLDTAQKVILRRLRGSGGGHPIGSWWTTTPDAPGSVLHRFFEDPKTRNVDSKVYRMSLFDNAENLPDHYLQQIQLAHTGGFADRFIWGRFAAVAEGALKFDTTIHIIDQIDLSVIKQVTYGVDWGWTNPAAIIAIGYDGDGRAYILDEYYKSQATIEELVESAAEMVQAYGDGPFICGHEEPRSIEKFRMNGLKARAWSGKREDGIREMGSRLERAGDGRPRLFVHRRCVYLISELQTYDPDVRENDHAVDALRMGLAMVVGLPAGRRGVVR